jgi:hypothetical protein
VPRRGNQGALPRYCAAGAKQDDGLHFGNTLPDFGLGSGGDDGYDNLTAHERARRAATTAAYELLQHFEALDLNEVCAHEADPEERAAVRQALEQEIAKLRRHAMGPRLKQL